MTLLFELMNNPWWRFFVGCCALAVAAAIVRNINQQNEVLPKPEKRCVCDEKLKVWLGL